MNAYAKVNINKDRAWKRTLEIEVPKEKVEEEYEQVFKKYKSIAKIPGFRPGKAPIEAIKSFFKEKADQDVIENLIPQAIEDAVKEANLIPITIPIVKDVKLEPGLPLKFKAEIEIRPEIEVKDYRGLAVTKKKFEVTEKDLEQTLNYLKNQNAQLRPVEREAKESDFLLVDLEKLPAKEVKGEKAQNQQVLLGKKNLLPEFYQAFLGVKIKDRREIEVNYPASYSDKSLAGKKLKYKVMIKEIKEKVLPEIDDLFAKSLGFKDLLDMRLKIREDLEKQGEGNSVKDMKNQLIHKVVEQNQFEAPESLIKSYLEGVEKEFKKNCQPVDEKELNEKYREMGIFYIRWDFLFHRIAEKEKIEVTTEDINDWTSNFALAYNLTQEKAKEYLSQEKRIKNLKETILEEKVLDLLLRNAIIVEEKNLK
jgi:trigger factor